MPTLLLRIFLGRKDRGPREGGSVCTINWRILLAFEIVFISVPASAFLDQTRTRGRSNAQKTSANLASPQTARKTGWKTCKNDTLGFEFQYPPNWEIFYVSFAQGGADRPATVMDSCDWPKSPGGDWAANLAARKAAERGAGLYMHVCDRGCMNHTIYKGAQTLKEYLAKKPVWVRQYPVVRRVRVGGEEAAVLKDGSMIAFHDGGQYSLVFGMGTPGHTRARLLETFNFLEPGH